MLGWFPGLTCLPLHALRNRAFSSQKKFFRFRVERENHPCQNARTAGIYAAETRPLLAYCES